MALNTIGITIPVSPRARAVEPVFDPLKLSQPASSAFACKHVKLSTSLLLPLLGGTAAPAGAAAQPINLIYDSTLDPSLFQPVCPASDNFYRFGQALVVGLVGNDNYKEFAPLIAGGLLRVRLELCVVESFVYEAIIPFIREKGLSWVLPWHETVETFLAGVIFAVASNFILIGSTKIVTVIFTYGDVFFGFPLRLTGELGWRSLEKNAEPMDQPAPPPKGGLFRGFFRKSPKREPPSLEEVIKANDDTAVGVAGLAVWGGMRLVGEASKSVRIGVEFLDVFVGRYLLLTTVAYVGLKFVHFKLLPDFP
eukprot:CAMPEP_0119316602 /NCGR_PEP_ID=MMETSP1333-20130426/40159_1 /TAXON_ID=418940 /ORGANISM="Scyphosphaera apsteinii, Strain RCC1455" /LENGTH=308 /DNA_ID=CAMNT_0007322291 /DNA_START=35 /DNA_END=961 /DNA_ORIENTATION=+